MMRLLIILLAMLCAFPAYAVDICTCHPRELEEDMAGAFAIFSGTVKSIERQFNPDRTRIEFDVHAVWRKVKNEDYAVYTQGADLIALAREGITCGYTFKRGETYLVYAWRSTSEHGFPWVSQCGHTKLLKDASNDIAALGPPVLEFDKKPMPEGPRDFTPTPLPEVPPIPGQMPEEPVRSEEIQAAPEASEGSTVPEDILEQVMPPQEDQHEGNNAVER